MFPGIDYVVRSPGKEENWLPFPDMPSSRSQDLRHTWVLVRRKRPVAPSFSGAPIPRHRPSEGERAAKITLAYFHPWTLRLDDIDPHVPHASQLKGEHATWQVALASWLDGGILSRESKRYVSNFLSVYRIRPTDDDEDDANSDDLVSDVELDVSHVDLAGALETRIGGHQVAGDEDEPQSRTHYENSRSGMERGKAMWAADDDDVSAAL